MNKKNHVSRGRPELDYVQCSTRSKRRKINHLSHDNNLEELTKATEKSLRREGNSVVANILKSVLKADSSPETILQSVNKLMGNKNQDKLSADEALALILSGNLTQHSYQLLRNKLKNLPSYKEIFAAKLAAMPDKRTITEPFCEVDLQSLLDHTISRILLYAKINYDSNRELILFCKYGFDGSSGHSQYKQKWNTPELKDSSLFITAVVPIEIRCKNTGEIVWKNERPSSHFFSRPVRMEWIKESEEVILKEHTRMQYCIKKLRPFVNTVSVE